jgi:hypothetical protein
LGSNFINSNNNEVFVPGGQDDYDEFNINYSDEGNNNEATKACCQAAILFLTFPFTVYNSCSCLKGQIGVYT